MSFSSLQPIHDPFRVDRLDPDLLLKDDDLIYTDEHVYPNGSVYRGQLKPQQQGDPETEDFCGVRHGYGVQVWIDGAKYKGYWVNNRA